MAIRRALPAMSPSATTRAWRPSPLELAGQIYGLVSLRADVADQQGQHNPLRHHAPRAAGSRSRQGAVITSFVFRVRSVPAALYKALGGFATNGVNITKLESYMVDGNFTVAQFYADIDGHPDQRSVRLALEELGFFSREVRILGVYPASPSRFGAETRFGRAKNSAALISSCSVARLS